MRIPARRTSWRPWADDTVAAVTEADIETGDGQRAYEHRVDVVVQPVRGRELVCRRADDSLRPPSVFPLTAPAGFLRPAGASSYPHPMPTGRALRSGLTPRHACVSRSPPSGSRSPRCPVHATQSGDRRPPRSRRKPDGLRTDQVQALGRRRPRRLQHPGPRSSNPSYAPHQSSKPGARSSRVNGSATTTASL